MIIPLDYGFYDIFESKAIKKNLRLFHVSRDNHDGETFRPRTPHNKMTTGNNPRGWVEDSVQERVCFGTSVRRAITALPGQDKIKPGDAFYVHIPIGQHPLFKPTTQEVPDAKDTYEYWICEPVELKCIGKVIVTDKKGDNWHYGCWNYKWVEKY